MDHIHVRVIVTPVSIPPAGPVAAFDAIEVESAVSAVARRLLDHFTSGALEPGTRLPAERQLAAQLGVGRSAVREALAALEILGIVSVRPGSGTYLRGTASELLPQTLSWGFMLGAPRTRELVELRHGLEMQAVRLAVRQASAEQVAELAETLDVMARHRDDFDRFVAADMRFHQLLADAGGNSLLADLLTTVRSLLRVWVERSVHDTDNTELTLAEHRRIQEAVAAGDEVAALAAMDDHMASASQRLLHTLPPEGEPGSR